MAARELLGSASRSGSSTSGVSLKDIPQKNMQMFGMGMPKPVSPRLAPLGSPGPVTPMELSSGEGGYLSKGMEAMDINANQEIRWPAGAISSVYSDTTEEKAQSTRQSPTKPGKMGT